jgi:hypothetical protein
MPPTQGGQLDFSTPALEACHQHNSPSPRMYLPLLWAGTCTNMAGIFALSSKGSNIIIAVKRGLSNLQFQKALFPSLRARLESLQQLQPMEVAPSWVEAVVVNQGGKGVVEGRAFR